MKIIFFGSDDFAARHLEALLGSDQRVCACVTPPDKPKGRGLKVSGSPVADAARRAGIEILQPAKLRGSPISQVLSELQPDIFVVIAYGQRLPDQLLGIPKKCAVNVHGSLLPQYRGAAPINWAIINGETQTGLTIFKLSAVMDAGAILAQTKIPISPEDTALTLRSRMMEIGPGLLLDTLEKIERDQVKSVPQDDRRVSFAPKLTKEVGRISWERSAEDIHNLVRGLLPWPAAFTTLREKMFKILAAMKDTSIESPSKASSPGTIVAIRRDGISVQTGRGWLLIKEVHPESGKKMDAYSFAQGYRLSPGMRLE